MAQIIVTEATNGFVLSYQDGSVEIIPSFRKLTAKLKEKFDKPEFPAYMGSISKTLKLVEKEDAGNQSNVE
jgi:hypothetical protein